MKFFNRLWHFFFGKAEEKLMGTPRLMFHYTFTTALDRDTKKAQFDLLSASDSKKDTIGTDQENNPTWSGDCLYITKQDLANSYNSCKGYVDASVISAYISQHICSHAKGESESQWTDCKQSEYAEFVK